MTSTEMARLIYEESEVEGDQRSEEAEGAIEEEIVRLTGEPERWSAEKRRLVELVAREKGVAVSGRAVGA